MSHEYRMHYMIILTVTLLSCAPVSPKGPIRIPAREYSKEVRKVESRQMGYIPQREVVETAYKDQPKARLRFVAGQQDMPAELGSNPEILAEDFSQDMPGRDYRGPLGVGDPGTMSSLWKESRAENDMFRDVRAWRPMDIITILISESAEGTKEADTETKGKSTVSASIENILKINEGVGSSTTPWVEASTQNDFKGEGTTSRKGTLKGTLSAMVVEVLPSGILRVEGEKILSVNNEEQVMVLSGLVRPRDITSSNEVDSSRIANMRIDYYGKGVVGEAQFGGWLGRALRVLWPF